MSILNKNNFSDEQLSLFQDFKRSDGWCVIIELVKNILKDNKVEDVNDNLPAEEYKIECLARRKAKDMFTVLFNDIDNINQEYKKSKTNYE